jgi:outer membrane biosynthesis protein TonB
MSVSPELVLVDPELAARARAGLPDRPWPAPVRIEPRPRAAPRSGVPTFATYWTFGLVLILVVFGLTLISTNDRPTFAAEGEPNQAAVPPKATPKTTPKTTPPSAPRVRKARTATAKAPPKKTAQTRTARPQPQPTRPQPQPSSQPKRAAPARRPVRPAGFRPARIFSWPPHAGASYYQVTFARNGNPFYRTRTNNARLRLPQGVRFTAGRYRWTVRPAIASDLGIQLARPIVDSTFEVSGN